MPTLVLLHGAALGSWCWDQTLSHLHAAGFNTVAIDLPLDDPSAGAARLADIAARELQSHENLTIVAHSIAGLVAPLIPLRLDRSTPDTGHPPAPSRVQRIVFLHAALPTPGHSLVSQLKTEPDMFDADMLAVPPSGWADPATAERFLFHDCTADIARAAFARLRFAKPGERVLVNETTPLKEWPNIRCSYILCQLDRTITPAWARRAAQSRLNITPIEISTGHCPMLSNPQALAHALSSLD